MTDGIEAILRRVSAFESAAHEMLSAFETAPSRVISVAATVKQIEGLNLKQSQLLRESVTATEQCLYRAAIILAWAAFMDFLQEKMASSEGLPALHRSRPAWTKHGTIDELRENVTEYHMLDAARDMRLLTKAECKALHGLLSKRNECAHPSGYIPSYNETLGYVSELLNRIPTINQRRVKV